MEDENIEKAIEVLRDGGIVIFPTDTAIGIGCRIDNKDSLRRLFRIRRRPENKPLLVLVDSVKMAQNYLLPIPKKVTDKLVKKYWPGPLTIILRCKVDKVPSLVRAGNTLGVRFPDSPELLKLIKGVGVPIASPSANFTGAKTPFKFEDLDPRLVKLADYVLEGKIDSEGEVSTIIDCSKEPWRVIRKGAVPLGHPEFISGSWPNGIPKQVRNDNYDTTTLILDTADNKKISIGLKINNKEYSLTKKIKSNKTQIVLPMIDSLLKKHKMKLEDIGEIKVNATPGSFTGLRVGMSIANALAFVLNIPVKTVK